MEINTPTQPINPPISPVQPVSKPANNKGGFFPIILGVLLLLVVVVGAGAYYLGMRNGRAIQATNIATLPTQAPTPTVYCIGNSCPTTPSSTNLLNNTAAKPTQIVSLTNMPVSTTENPMLFSYFEKIPFRKRQYDSNTLFMGNNGIDDESAGLLSVLTSYKDDDLISMRCSSEYRSTPVKGSNEETFRNTPVEILVKKIQEQDPRPVDLTLCDTQDGKLIAAYTIANGGMYFAYVERDLSVIQIIGASVTRSAGYYVWLSDIYQLTADHGPTDSELFFSVGSGDVSSGKSLAKLNMQTGEITTVYSCRDDSNAQGSKPPYITCSANK